MASRLFNGVAIATSGKSWDYEEGISLIRTYGDKTLFDLVLVIVKKTAPMIGYGQTLSNETLGLFLDAMGTRENAKDLLASTPDIDAEKMGIMIQELDLLLPSLRKILLPFAKQLPPPPGGHPRKIAKEEEPRIREEIARLYKTAIPFLKPRKSRAQSRCKRFNYHQDSSEWEHQNGGPARKRSIE